MGYASLSAAARREDCDPTVEVPANALAAPGAQVPDAPAARPGWADLIDFSEQPTAAPEQPAPPTEQRAEQPRPTRAARVLDYLGRIAARLTRHTDGQEAIAAEGHASQEHIGSRRAPVAEHRHRHGARSAAARAITHWGDVVTPSEASIVVRPATVQHEVEVPPEPAAEPAPVDLITEPAVVDSVAEPATIEIAPVVAEPDHTPAVPSTDLVHVPRPAAAKEAQPATAPVPLAEAGTITLDDDPEAVLLAGLQAAGYPSVEALREASLFALPKEKLGMQRVLDRIVRRAGKVWLGPAERDGNKVAGQKFQDISALAAALTARLALNPQFSPEAKAREAIAERMGPNFAEMMEAKRRLQQAAN